MSLQTLPLEVLCMIFRFIGSDSLRKHDVCCLLVSKWWYELVEPILLEDMTLDATRLKHTPEKSLTKLRMSLRRLTINIKPISDEQVNEDLTDTLGQLNQLLPCCARLNTFILRAESHFDPDKPLAPYTNYLGLWSPTSLLDMLQFSKLSDLVIDTCGSDFNGEKHICSHIALKIPSLRSIRLRMRHICPRVLQLEHGSKVQSIIINLSLKESHRFHAGFSRHCTESTKSPYDLNTDMVLAATNVAKNQPSIKMLRIICHKHPYLEILSSDCINGNQMILSDDGEWDWSDDGPLYLPSQPSPDQDLFESSSEDEVFVRL